MVAARVLAGLLLVAGVSRSSGAGVAAIVAVSLLWLLVNAPMEGPVLISISAAPGTTGADLARFAGLTLASWAGSLFCGGHGEPSSETRPKVSDPGRGAVPYECLPHNLRR